MSHTQHRHELVSPRIEAEELPAPRLESIPLSAETGPRPRWGLSALVSAGLTVLVLGFAALETGNFVADEFARSPMLGWLSAAVSTLGFGLVGLGFWREYAALAALRGVDRLRANLHSTDPVRRARAARAWVRRLPEAATLLPAIDKINDPDAILALLRAGPAAQLRAKSEALGRAAAMQAVAGVAAMPSPGLAGIFIAWRGLRLVRQIATLYGLRPGFFGTLGLVRRTVTAAASVAGVEMAANTAAHAVLSGAVAQHLAGEMAAAGVAARRMVVLARAAAVACSAIDEE